MKRMRQYSSSARTEWALLLTLAVGPTLAGRFELFDGS